MLNNRILDRYIIIKYIVTFLTMLVLFIPISVLVDLSQKIGVSITPWSVVMVPARAFDPESV